MKNSLIRRSATGALAVAMIFSTYSCGEKKNNDESSQKETPTNAVQTADKVVTKSYSSIDIDIDIPVNYVSEMLYIKDTAKVLILGDGGNGTSLYLTDMDFSGFNEVPFDFPKTENSQSYMRTAIAQDGSIYVIFTLIDYGDFKLPDYDDPDFDYENFDFDAMNAAAKYSYTLYKLDSDGKMVSETPLDFSEYSKDSSDGNIYINNLMTGKDGKLVVSLSGEKANYLIMDETGKISGNIESESENHWINYFANDADGNIFGAGYGEKGEMIELLDIDSKKFTDSGISFDQNNYIGIDSMNTGNGEYSLFLNTQNGLYGIDKDKKPVELVNWLDSDIKTNTVRGVIGLDDGDFIIYYNDYESNTNGFARLTKRSAEELANQTVITVGVMYSDQSVTSKITEFNKSHSDYRIKIADYSKYNEYDEKSEKMLNSAEKQLKMDIVSGEAPDMIITYDMKLISELYKKDIYTDLYTYLENDEELSKDDFMPNVLKACEFDGKLYSLTPSFSVASFACKTKFCDKENWTLDDMIETFHDNPDMEFLQYSNSKEEVFDMLATSADSFIDYDKLECHFDSDEFKKILEFANEFPDESEQINWETATQDEMEEYWNEQQTKCMDDKALLGNVNLYEFTGYSEAKHVTFNEDITIVGIPSDDGKGGRIVLNNSIAILASSPSKDACWEFMKEFFKEDTNQRYRYSYGLPSLVSEFDKKAEESMSKPYWIDDDGNKVEYDNTYYVNNREITIPPLTKEEKDFIVDYIKNTDKVYRGYSEDILDILKEETTKYFKDECSAQQAIDKLQGRIDILINEQA
ncbi:MAG: ABC transporter substrate-binding protein [Ruminococcus sp.]|nr:ABC transporter substrate-binding protein [Ruminococcus sp.]